MKRLILSIMILAVLLASTSCQGIDTAKENSDLSIYLFDFDITTKETIQKFNSGREKGKINAQTFFIDQYEDYQNQLLSKLSTGAGPDIIMYYSNYITNISKFLSLDAYYDINELIKDDSTFKPEDYNQKIMDCGVKDGKRYMIPLSFTVEALFSTDEILKANSLNLDNKVLSLDDMLTLSKNFKGQNGSKFINHLPYMAYINHFVDPLSQTASLGTEEFRLFMDQYKALNQSSTVSADQTQLSSLLSNGKTALLDMPVYGVKSLLLPFQDFDKAINPVLIPFTLGRESKQIATPHILIAINKNCANKKTAYEFVKTLLSTEEQRLRGESTGIPVNLEAYEKNKETCSGLISSQSGGIRDEAALSRLITKLDEIIKGDLTCRLTDLEAGEIVSQELMNYQAGSKTLEAASKDMQDKLNDYFKKSSVAAPSTQSNNPGNTDKLTIHYMDYSWSIKNAIRSFNDDHKDIQIEGTVYANKAREDYITKLTTSVMAGAGPDILVYNPTFFNSIRKTMATGAFVDLNELIAKDSSFDTSTYYPDVFNAGVMNDKRFFIPLNYDIPTLIASKSALSTLGLSIDESGWTVSDLRAAVARYKASNPSSGQYFFDPSMSFRALVRLCGIQLIDYQNQTTRFQSREFIDLLTLYKELASVIMTPEIEMNLDLTPILLKNRTIMMSVLRGQSPEQLSMTNSVYTSELKDDFVILPPPTLEAGAKYPIQLNSVVSINAKCNNQQAAFDFVKVLLSEDIQRANDSHGNSNITYGTPINKNAFQKDLEEVTKPVINPGITTYSNGMKSLSVVPIPLPNALADQAKHIINQMGPSQFLDNEVENIINEGLETFLKGKRTAEQAAKDIDEKITLFLNE